MMMPTLGVSSFVLLLGPSSMGASAIGWTAPLLDGGALVQPIPTAFKSSISGGFLQNPGEAVLDRLGGFGRDLLSELPKLLVLRGGDFEVLAALRG
jgi:hypothetical protein